MEVAETISRAQAALHGLDGGREFSRAGRREGRGGPN
jgi:hypothetical protein